MRGSRSRRWLIAACALSLAQLGAPCGPPPAPPSSIRIDPPTVTVVSPTHYFGTADIVIETGSSYQAYELTLSWDTSALVVTQIDPHPDFDDDGHFALPVSLQPGAGTTTVVVDLRHGAPVVGAQRVASIAFTSPSGLAGTLSVSGTVAAPDGSIVSTGTSASVSVP